MPATLEPDVVQVNVEASTLVFRLESLTQTAGSRPAEAIALMAQEGLEFGIPTMLGRTATVVINGVQVLTGHIVGQRKRLSDLSCSVRILDKRLMINKTWIGARHLVNPDQSEVAPNHFGLSVLGPEPIFNFQGKPNRSKTIGAGFYPFVYGDGNTQFATDCSVIEADYWTYGQILAWVWKQYVDDVTMPNIPSGTPTGQGFERIASELNLFGLTVGQAIDEIFSHTNCSWSLAGDGTAYIFSRPYPRTTTTLAFLNLGGTNPPVTPAATYTLDYPSEFDVDYDSSEVVRYVDVVSGREIREVMLQNGYTWNPASPSTDTASGVTSDWLGPEIFFEEDAASFDKPRWDIWRFDGMRFAAHGAGFNVREKDRGVNKVFLGSLLIRKSKTGLWVTDPLSECGIYSAESVIIRYPYTPGAPQYGQKFQMDRGLYFTGPHSGGATRTDPYHGPPFYIVTPVLCETRKSYVATSPIAATTLSTRIPIRRPIIRDDIQHWSREAIKLPTVWDEGLLDYTYDDIDAGIILDGQQAVIDLAEDAQPEIGRPAVSIRGEFPSYRTLEIGTKIYVSGGNFDTTNDEIVVATVYRGDRQSLEFYATNYIGAGLSAVASEFCDRRRYRR